MNENNSIKPSNTPVPTKDIQRSTTLRATNEYEPNCVLQEAEKQMATKGGTSYVSDGKDAIFKAMTLTELENGTLLTMSTFDVYKTFAIDLMRKLQHEYCCETSSEKATAEIVALNFTRTLDIQRRLTNSLNSDNISSFRLSYLNILSKELDRANRHYLASLQALRTLRQPPLQLSIKAVTAVVGQNQIVQANPNDKPK